MRREVVEVGSLRKSARTFFLHNINMQCVATMKYKSLNDKISEAESRSGNG